MGMGMKCAGVVKFLEPVQNSSPGGAVMDSVSVLCPGGGVQSVFNASQPFRCQCLCSCRVSRRRSH